VGLVKSARHDVKLGLLVDGQTFEQQPICPRQQTKTNTMHRLGGGSPENAAALEQDVETHKRIVDRFHRMSLLFTSATRRLDVKDSRCVSKSTDICPISEVRKSGLAHVMVTLYARVVIVIMPTQHVGGGVSAMKRLIGTMISAVNVKSPSTSS
jgi:GTP cyclohydrolase I